MKRKNKKLKIQVSLPRLSWVENNYENAVKFFLNELKISTRLQNTLNIKVHIRKTVLAKNVLGNCNITNNGSISTKDFKITLSSDRTYSQQLQTLAHECVHIEQACKNRLQTRVWSSDNQTHVRWEGEEQGVWMKDVSYEDAPWEIEARNLQEKLVRKFYSYQHKN
jgi:hypothetical protein